MLHCYVDELVIWFKGQRFLKDRLVYSLIKSTLCGLALAQYIPHVNVKLDRSSPGLELSYSSYVVWHSSVSTRDNLCRENWKPESSLTETRELLTTATKMMRNVHGSFYANTNLITFISHISSAYMKKYKWVISSAKTWLVYATFTD